MKNGLYSLIAKKEKKRKPLKMNQGCMPNEEKFRPSGMLKQESPGVDYLVHVG
jgi:hypothetical protein